jgi:cellulose synthase/poly-beta-1,6-N-acetylglucosamine synthase-like glycosyltransferase
MIDLIGYLVLGLFLVAITLITIYCIIQFHLAIIYRKNSGSGILSKDIKIPENAELPLVTVQLPVFNEVHVIERLIDNICHLDYPKDKLQIQVLDDSTDVTTMLAEQKATFYRERGIDIEVIRRPERVGFKAGALQYGVNIAKGEFIAIFDADFLPSPDFLKQTIPHFEDEKTGVVQTRWEHLNENYSLLTAMQAFQLNVHFSIEQRGREKAGLFLQFNGTAGVWRKSTIEDAGGWKADTLTEDLDLSFRAQLKGWKIRFLEEVGSPAELPADMNALKAQQYRWMKGGAENALKIIPSILQSSQPLRRKFHGVVHLLGSTVFLLVFTLGILSFPLIYYLNYFEINTDYFAVFLIGIIALVFVYLYGNVWNPFKKRTGNQFQKVVSFPLMFLTFLSLSMGMSLHNTRAVLHGYMSKRTPFLRTPKFNITTKGQSVKKSSYLPAKIPTTSYFEAILALYFAAAVYYGWSVDQHAFLIYHLLLAIGFATISYYSFRHFQWKD